MAVHILLIWRLLSSVILTNHHYLVQYFAYQRHKWLVSLRLPPFRFFEVSSLAEIVLWSWMCIYNRLSPWGIFLTNKNTSTLVNQTSLTESSTDLTKLWISLSFLWEFWHVVSPITCLYLNQTFRVISLSLVHLDWSPIIWFICIQK